MLKLKFCAIAFCLFGLALSQRRPEAVLYEWTHMNFTWPSRDVYQRAVKSGEYIPENNALAGIKFWKDRIYMTLPRWKRGVAATLVTTSVKPIDGNGSPNVEPYPNWEMQKVGDCSAFQFVQSMEIDPNGRMCLVDVGRIGIFSDEPQNLCPARLVILDLENNGKILVNYEFPDHVAGRNDAYLNGLVLDPVDGAWAYISDSSDTNPGIIVFSLKSKTSWKMTHRSMWATAVQFTIKYENVKVDKPQNVYGIALSASSRKFFRTLYYSPGSSLETFAVPTVFLRRNVSIDRFVRNLGHKRSQNDGMLVSAKDNLYFGSLVDNAVTVWDTEKPPFSTSQRQIFQDNATLQWPSTFAINDDGELWCTCNRLQNFLIDKVNLDEVNYRVVKLGNIGCKSYLYFEDGTFSGYPEFPEIS